jgi:alpha-L-rhamnosidase
MILSSVLLSSSKGRVDEKVLLQNLRCEMLANPEGIDVTTPRLSWVLSGDQRGIAQTAYQILVASSPEKLAANEGDLWNSGKVSSSQSIHVAYAGVPLKSRKECFWKVKTWTTNGESAWSKPAFWSMGLLNYVDWKGRWIGLDRAFPWDRENTFSKLSARYLRKEFDAKKEIKQAKAYIIGLGLYELYLNGQRIGDQVLAPAPTDYTQGVKYNTFDVTANLKKGTNAIGTVLGNGRYYTMRQNYKPYKIKTFGYPKLLFQLEIEYADGTSETIKTDDAWKITPDGPIRANNEYDGEEYDARKEMPGWNKTGFDDSNWVKAEYVQEARGNFEAQMNENMKVMGTVKPVSVTELKPGTHILDMGQNMVGWLQMKVKGSKGDSVKLRFAESLQEKGELFVANLRDAKVTDVYILKGEGGEVWEPSFVYHGFRFVEVTGYPGTPTANDFEGKVVYDNLETTGTFETSSPTINQVYTNAYWGIRGNYKGMPIDCPQRNERQPWLGDRTTGAYGESFIFDNAKLYAKWLDDIKQSQKEDGAIPDVAPAFWRYYGDDVTWPGTYLTVADMLYQQYGDKRSIEKHYDSMKKWMKYMEGKYMKGYTIAKDRYGDWCVPPESEELIHSQDPARKTDGEVLATATYYHMLDLMQKFAKLVNKPQDAKEFAELAANVKYAFNNKFLDKESLQYSNNTVTANILPLSFGMVPQGAEDEVFKNIVDKTMIENKGHISTGVIGTQWLMRGLTNHGRPDIAFKLATNRDYPSWGYMAENGATTIWELWNGNTADPGMNSQNHVMLLGDLVVWYYENLAGIKSGLDSPGFKQIEMKPLMVDGLDHVKASFLSMYGPIRSDWRKNGEQFSWNITVPGNTKAEVYIPARSKKAVTESGKPASSASGVKFLRMEGDRAVFEVGSGDYSFVANN